jgi:hypothetical protein
MKVVIDETLTGKELYTFLKANKAALIAQKKYEVKRGDAIGYSRMLLTDKGEAVKANDPIDIKVDADTIEVVSVINTTNWMDSHKDVHLPGIWKKTLQENKDLYLLEEHNFSFRGIITDHVKAYTQLLTWKSLGIDKEGSTEALVFQSKITKDRNPYMFGEYKAGHVKNHSVGMRYIDIQMAINDEDYKEEYAVWNKYIDVVANKEEAEETGYFFAVKEAKAIEGSAVPRGSNIVTPVLNVSDSTKQQPEPSTVELPQPTQPDTLNIKQLLTIF